MFDDEFGDVYILGRLCAVHLKIKKIIIDVMIYNDMFVSKYKYIIIKNIFPPCEIHDGLHELCASCVCF